MIINIPIEPIPMRYSVDWVDWFFDYFTNNNIEYASINGEELTKGIEQGRFLDCVGTNYYKSSQLMIIMQSIHEGKIKDGDVLFFHDLWFPGIEQIKYTCQAMNLNIKIMGCLHAGAYDPHDFLYQQKMGKWAVHFEHMLFSLTDKIFVATEFHKNLIIKSRSLEGNKIKVTGFPFISRKMKLKRKKNQIVFPHRNNPEKNIDTFFHMKNIYKDLLPGWDWVTTYQLKDKEEYYRVLEESKIAISFSDQETWGIAMQECVIAGCIPLVPNKLSYVEMFDLAFRYNDLLFIKEKLKWFVSDYANFQVLLMDQIVKFEHDGQDAFENITYELTWNI